VAAGNYGDVGGRVGGESRGDIFRDDGEFGRVVGRLEINRRFLALLSSISVARREQ
jgi:hypothetical protein